MHIGALTGIPTSISLVLLREPTANARFAAIKRRLTDKLSVIKTLI